MSKRENQLEIKLRKEQCLKETTKLVSETDKENRKWTCENFAEKDIFNIVKGAVFSTIAAICLGLLAGAIGYLFK